MPALVKANPNTIGSGLPYNVLSNDSGQIVCIQGPGKAAVRLTTGIQQQPTQAIQCDSTAGAVGNTLLSNTNSPFGAAATITNITVAAAVNNVNTITLVGTNSFVAGQTIIFKGLTTVPSINDFCAVVLATGLSGSGWQCTLTGFQIASVGSSSETGTASVGFFGKPTALSLSPSN